MSVIHTMPMMPVIVPWPYIHYPMGIVPVAITIWVAVVGIAVRIIPRIPVSVAARKWESNTNSH
jgi:hypothetical protein